MLVGMLELKTKRLLVTIGMASVKSRHCPENFTERELRIAQRAMKRCVPDRTELDHTI